MTEQSDSRHLVVVSILVSIIFAILLAVGLGIVGGKAITASRDAKNASALAIAAAADAKAAAEAAKAAAAANTATLHQNCLKFNEANAATIQSWEYIVNINPNPSPEQKATSDGLLDYLRTTFAQQPCP